MVPELERCGLAPSDVPTALSGVFDLEVYEYSFALGCEGYWGGDMTAPSAMDGPESDGCLDG